MKTPYFIVDAFAEDAFTGNPAGVCLLPHWLPTETMQAIANENAVAATAFVVSGGHGYEVRWFTPLVEEEMCGHATLGAAWVILNRVQPHLSSVVFASPAGRLEVGRDGDRYMLDLPARPPRPVPAPAGLAEALGARPREVLRATYFIAVFDTATELAALKPDFAALARQETPGIIATAPGADIGCDIATRYFAPAKGIPEDHVTGSAHAQIVPFWAERLGRSTLEARQLSKRGGRMTCSLRGDHVRLSAPARLYMSGEIEVSVTP
ncbi:MAG TPA: PhzF family phenazine biosynthesis protein [Stellaceae bacterium]|nr:PhzF family phenazine biosynthesis protein [Stellaceae bacterium]